MGEEFDLIVVGAGTAGLPCAIEAAGAGARVAVVEKTDEIGGTLHLSAASLAGAGSRRQRRRGIDDSPGEHVADVMRISGGTADEALVTIVAREAATTIDWLDDQGFDFDPASPVVYEGYEPYSKARVYFAGRLGLSVLGVLEPLWTACVERDGIVPLLGHRFVDLLRDGDRVAGVAVEAGGRTRELAARATVLATGGYGCDPELFAELTPGSPRLVTAARTSSTGDGLRIARFHGAAVRGTECYVGTLGGIEQQPGSGRAEWWDGYANLHPSDRMPREIHVNARGERFVAEDEPSAAARQQALLAQPERTMWVVFDETALAGEPLVPQWEADDLRAHAARGTCVFAADDIETLGARAGIEAAGLARTVAAWNDAVTCGYDSLGRRALGLAIERPPFYALETRAITLFTFAGLAVDPELRVLTEAGRPIPGLHAVGEVIGGFATTGSAFCTGMLVTPALVLGRRLGRRLAAAVA